ncbi:hypothetical protein ASPBRDRAFT_75961 [Aspergillus brasiliensis CBS 101740]|uniref:Uncharacterized protein n=1 Tax=Aspergillus brasiliensis (strain CBS 101740 / IMI 381727 / IBT 21946) TaxID=767769 RepID=A0A1L9UIF3_ASPBC|nr:hypothetical protein ASPBRDRAFT_75961 [Aspergillus brasiliensis CBS 101740]
MPLTSKRKKAQQEPDALANHCPQVMHHRSNDPPRLDPFAPLKCSQPPPPVRLKQLVPLFQKLQGGALLPAFYYSIRSAASTSSCNPGPIIICFCIGLVPDIATTLPQPLPYDPSAVAPTHGGLYGNGGAEARISEGNSSAYAILVRPSPKTADLRHPHMQGIPYPVIYHMDPHPPSSACLAQHY